MRGHERVRSLARARLVRSTVALEITAAGEKGVMPSWSITVQ